MWKIILLTVSTSYINKLKDREIIRLNTVESYKHPSVQHIKTPKKDNQV